jgi:thymidine kinase
VKDNPKFTLYVGSMFSGKTTRLLGMLERFKYQHKRIVAFKPVIDDRYAIGEIATHGGWKFPATCVSTGSEIYGALSTFEEVPHVIAVDEAFMIPGVSNALIYLYKLGFDIAVSSLDMSATVKPFNEIEKMLPWATHVEKCSAVCTTCGRDAYYTYKKQAGGGEIEIGGAELYEPRCAMHHPLVMSQDVLVERIKTGD